MPITKNEAAWFGSVQAIEWRKTNPVARQAAPIFLLCSFLLFVLWSSPVFIADAVTPTAAELASARQWCARTFEQSAAAHTPFSFEYDGQSSTNFLKKWDLTRTSKKLDENRTEHVLQFRNPKDGLEVRCVAMTYRDFPTVEWTLYFKNIGTNDSALLSDVEAVDLRVKRQTTNEFLLHYNNGSPANLTDYGPAFTSLPVGASKTFAGEGGRPTSSDWPYFNLEWGEQGMIVVVGWPGQWKASFSRVSNDRIRIRAGQQVLRAKLHPGEEIRSPLIVLQFWKNRDWIDAQNIWRRWMVAHNVPRPGGHPLQPMLFACSSSQLGEMIHANEQNQIMFIKRYLEEGLKIDCWWMDAGWYPCRGNLLNTGTWEVDPKRFPHGFKPISDYAHSHGVKIVVWFEPERVAQNTWLMDNHPEWVIPNPGAGGATHNLLNLGNPDAWHWLVKHVDDLLNSQGIDLYRQDCNIDPFRFWNSVDKPDRQGITENRYVTAYLAFWDTLLQQHPNLSIDACASGGRRNDLESMRRAVPRTRSDYIFDPIGGQCHTYGISFWLPYYGTGVKDLKTELQDLPEMEKLWNILNHSGATNPATEGQSIPVSDGSRFGPGALGKDDRYLFRSAMCPSMTLCFDVRRKDLDYALLRRLLSQWRQLAPYYFGDYYPLTAYSTGTDVWMAWEFNLPESGRGMIQVFRRQNSPYESARFNLRDLDPDADYTVSNLDTGESSRASGQELLKAGIEVRLPDRPQAAILTYKKVKP